MKVCIALVRGLLGVELLDGSPSLSSVRLRQHSKINVLRTSHVDGVRVGNLVGVDLKVFSLFHLTRTRLQMLLLLYLIEFKLEIGWLRL